MEHAAVAQVVAGALGALTSILAGSGLLTSFKDRMRRGDWSLKGLSKDQAENLYEVLQTSAKQPDEWEPTGPDLPSKPPRPRMQAGGSTTLVLPRAEPTSGNTGRLTLVTAFIAGLAVLGAALISRSGPTPPDCVAYAQEIQSLSEHYKPAQLNNALKVLKFDRYEHACGDAGEIAKRLQAP